jgi:hypothetical protein
MTGHYYGSLVSTAIDTAAADESSSLKVRIAWWLVPSAAFYLLATVFFQ